MSDTDEVGEDCCPDCVWVEVPEHVLLAEEAREAGLIVTLLMPNADPSGDRFNIQFWNGDGELWVESNHDTADTVRWHIKHYAERFAS